MTLAANPMTESKEDQWMGVTVQSQGPGGNVVVSAKGLTKTYGVCSTCSEWSLFLCSLLKVNLPKFTPLICR